jgi:hypothetical protein
MNKRGLSYLLASFDFESGHDQMLPQPPLCTSTVFFCFPSSSSSSSSSAFSSFFLPAPQRPNTYFRGQTRRKEEIDVSARGRRSRRKKEREKRNGEHSCTDKEPRTRRDAVFVLVRRPAPAIRSLFTVLSSSSSSSRSKTHLRINTHSFECRRRDRSSFLHS